MSDEGGGADIIDYDSQPFIDGSHRSLIPSVAQAVPMARVGHFDWHKTPNRWIVCGCGQWFKVREEQILLHSCLFPSVSHLLGRPRMSSPAYLHQERERAAHIYTEAHEKWMNSASAFTLAAFVPHHQEMGIPEVSDGEEEGRAPIHPSPAPALTPAHAKSPLMEKSENRCDKTPGPTPATVFFLPSSPPFVRHRDLFHPAAESPVAPRKEDFEEEEEQ